MGSAPHPEAVADVSKDVVAFEVVSTEPGTNGVPPRGQIRILEALRGELSAGLHTALYPPPSDASFYVIRGGGEEALARWKAQALHGPRPGQHFVAVVHAQPTGLLLVDARAIWPDDDLRRARAQWGVNAAVTIIACDADDPDAFEQMTVAERRERCGGWKRFPLRSGRRLDTFVMFATHHDLGVFGCAEAVEDGHPLNTNLIDKETILERLPILERLVEQAPEETARLLHVHGGGTGDLARITEALTTGTWPANGDPAEEAAAFAHQLLAYGRYAKDSLMGVCWEYRGPVTAFLPPPPTDRTRALERVHARMCTASAGLAYMEFWEHGGRASATREECARMEAEVAETTREHAAAKAELEALVTKLRAEAPAELDAWAFAHYCYISQFLHECAERRDESDAAAVMHATRERAAWAEVRAGTRPFVEGSSWVRGSDHFYRRYFGIDPKTLEPITESSLA